MTSIALNRYRRMQINRIRLEMLLFKRRMVGILCNDHLSLRKRTDTIIVKTARKHGMYKFMMQNQKMLISALRKLKCITKQ